MDRAAMFFRRVRLVKIIFAILGFAIADLPGAQKEWITLESCQLLPNPANDGDSFHIRANDTEYLLRLYLVDAPETEAVNPARLIEQAKYFGITVPQAIEIGETAKLFVRAKLAQPFTVYTHMAGGMGRSKIARFYGFVQTKEGDLGEQLVANGLARIHGVRGTPPTASSSADEIQKLEQLEQSAKQRKLGGWAGNSGKFDVLQQDERKSSSAKSVDQTIAKPVTTSVTAAPQPTGTVVHVAISSAEGQNAKLGVNTATQEQLEKIPGIGRALAQRIIAARPFKSADDLKKVKGVGGRKRYEEVRPFFQ